MGEMNNLQAIGELASRTTIAEVRMKLARNVHARDMDNEANKAAYHQAFSKWSTLSTELRETIESFLADK